MSKGRSRVSPTPCTVGYLPILLRLAVTNRVPIKIRRLLGRGMSPLELERFVVEVYAGPIGGALDRLVPHFVDHDARAAREAEDGFPRVVGLARVEDLGELGSPRDTGELEVLLLGAGDVHPHYQLRELRNSLGREHARLRFVSRVFLWGPRSVHELTRVCGAHLEVLHEALGIGLVGHDPHSIHRLMFVLILRTRLRVCVRMFVCVRLCAN